LQAFEENPAMACKECRRLTICLGSSCFARGNGENLPRIQSFLASRQLEDEVQLKGIRCEGQCQHGPILRIGDTLIEDVQPTKLTEILERLL
jgi:NADH:ubiquinone oxidoreductase subunit E